MTATTASRSRTIANTGSGPLTGTATLVRFMLRRDRIKLPAWTLGIVTFWLYYTRLVPTAYGTEADLKGVSALVQGPMGRLYSGPGYGFDDLTYDRFIAGAYGLYLLLLGALMSILLVVRHTRVEEQTGRAELVRANIVGRHAPLTATLTVAAITNIVVTVAVAVVSMTSPEMGARGSVLLAAGVGAAGLAFAGLSAVTVQLTAFSRAAAGLAGGGLGAAFAIRAVGDALREGGSVLSWFSPLAWSQQTAPFVFDRWWPLAFPVGFAAATTAVGYHLSARRDLGASMFATRPGHAQGPRWLRSPLTLAARLQRASILSWTSALAASGLLFGAFADAMVTSVDDLPETLIDVMGGPDDVVAGYLGLMAVFMALITGIYAILAMQSLRNEETSGRGEPVLATPVSRWEWLGAHLAVTSVGVLAALTATGAATGVGAAIVTGDVSHIWELTTAHLAYLPAVCVVLAVAAALFGLAPKYIALAWALLAYGLIAGLFGPLMDLPGWAYNASPFEHVPRMPLDSFAAVPIVALTLVAAALALLALTSFSRREVNVT